MSGRRLNMAKLTAKQERFVEEYLVDLNATQAAIRAGYSPASAGTVAGENMKKPQIRARLDEAMAELSRRTGVNQERVIRELARVAFVNAPKVVNTKDATVLEDASEDDTAAIASIKVKVVKGDFESVEREVKFADKLKALELLGKHFGMFTDKVSLVGAVPVQIVDDLDD
jgi:phage terminase small subunit